MELSQLQKEADDIMRELLKTQKDEEKEEPHYTPVKKSTLVRQLFIANLPFRVRWQDIKDLFRKAGQVVRANVALNHEDRSKGHGTVLFATVADAQNGIDMFNGYKWHGRILEVREDRGFVDNVSHQDTSLAVLNTTAAMSPKKDKDSVVYEKSLSTTTTLPMKKKQQTLDEDEFCKQLFVGNLPFNCHWQDLKDIFKNSGKILKADVVLSFEGRSRGFGTILFSSHEDAKKAIEKFNGYKYDNRTLRVHFDKFAASHQRLREHEAETHGQRQIHDPASVELLRQTYLPQQTAYQNITAGLVNPDSSMQTSPPYSYQSSLQQPHVRQQSFEDITSTNTTIPSVALTAATYIGFSSPINNLNNPFDMYHPQQYYQYNPLFFANMPPPPEACSSTITNDNRQIYTDNFGNFSQYPYQQQWYPAHTVLMPPVQDYQQQGQQKEEETLSTTLERLSLSNNEEFDSAGLNKSLVMNGHSSWDNKPDFREK